MKAISEQRFDVSTQGSFKFTIRNADQARGMILEFGINGNGNCSGNVYLFLGDATSGIPWMTVPAQTGRIGLTPQIGNITVIPGPGAEGLLTCILTDEPMGYGVYQLIAEASTPPTPQGTLSLQFGYTNPPSSGAAEFLMMASANQGSTALLNSGFVIVPAGQNNGVDFVSWLYSDIINSDENPPILFDQDQGTDTVVLASLLGPARLVMMVNPGGFGPGEPQLTVNGANPTPLGSGAYAGWAFDIPEFPTG